MPTNLHQFETNRELAAQLAQRIAGDLARAIEQRGVATLAVSGGSTPKPLFECLSHRELDWSSVFITQVDERWVDETHQDSNARLIQEHLLHNAAANARFVSMKTPHGTPYEAESDASKKLAAFAEGIDVVVLGMGEDGHTASFFPDADALDKALALDGGALCIAITPPVAPHPRMTLSLAALLRARHTYLHISGEKKWSVLERARDPGDVRALPIRSVLQSSEVSVEIYYASRN